MDRELRRGTRVQREREKGEKVEKVHKRLEQEEGRGNAATWSKGLTHIFEQGTISHCLLLHPGMLQWSRKLHLRGREGEMRWKVSKKRTICASTSV